MNLELINSGKMENCVPKPTISACMIVKNEEELLPTCLNSIKNAVDEIIIVDTGSTDNTISIAKRFGAKVFHFPWNDSFSDARNHALRYATGDWILQIDADEELEQADVPTLRQAINNDKYNGILIAIQSIIKDAVHKFYNTRVFRRGKAFYRDIIHEQIVVDGERLPTEIRLYHHGYNLDEKKMQMKWQMTTRLLKKQISQNKHDCFAWFNLIRNYRSQDLFQDGVNAGEEALTLITPGTHTKSTGANNDLHLYTMIIYETANCHLHVGNYARAKELCHIALSKLAGWGVTPENVDIVFTLASACLKEGNYQEAIDYFNRFLLLREWHIRNLNSISLIVDTLGYDYSAHNGLGCCFVNLGQIQTGISHLQKAVCLNPRYLTAYKNLASCYSADGNTGEAIHVLLKTVSEGIADSEVLFKLGDLYMKQESYKDAIPYFETLLKKCPTDKNALLKISRCYERLGHLEAALVGYKAALGNK